MRLIMSLRVLMHKNRGLGSSVGMYISFHQLFFMTTPLLFADRFIGSCMWDGKRHLSELYMGLQQLHQPSYNRWRMLENGCGLYVSTMLFRKLLLLHEF